MTYVMGVVTGICASSTLWILALFFSKGRQTMGIPLTASGSPLVFRRHAEKKKPKIQDDHKAWIQEQKESKEKGLN
jgi:hypothetical protein